MPIDPIPASMTISSPAPRSRAVIGTCWRDDPHAFMGAGSSEPARRAGGRWAGSPHVDLLVGLCSMHRLANVCAN